MKIEYCVKHLSAIKDITKSAIKEFCETFSPQENILYIFEDELTKAFFCECHIAAQAIIDYGTIDVPLDAENQADYRANRDVVEDNVAFLQMKEDALKKRSFSNIVAEYNKTIDKEHPLKIIGGQHRFIAISEALQNEIDQVHGLKVYFGLNMNQRLDVQLISNTNIAVSSDLLDRMLETVKGPELRGWCQKAGLLKEHEDFADKKQRGSRFTVRAARTFIMNYYEGIKIASKDFTQKKTTPVLAKTGGVDEEWEKLKISHPQMWEDPKLLAAGKAFSALIQKQRTSFTKEDGKVSNGDYADKASSYAIIAAWAFVAGNLNDNKVRLERHYALSQVEKPTRLITKSLLVQDIKRIRITIEVWEREQMQKNGDA